MYGHISAWDVSRVTDMGGLFCANRNPGSAQFGCSGVKAEASTMPQAVHSPLRLDDAPLDCLLQ